jgi:HlyD family secretion protein
MNDQSELPSEPATAKPPAMRSAIPAHRLSHRPFWIAGLVVAAAIVWGGYGHWQRAAQADETQRETVDFKPVLQVAVAQRTDGTIPLKLPGSTAAFEQARIFARATGYIAERRVDIGSRVHQGDLLARIAAPDLDQQLKQAEATLAQRAAALQQAQAQVNQAQSNKDLATVTNGRTTVLARQGWETQQNADQTRLGLVAQNAAVVNAQAGVAVAQAALQTQLAIARQLQELTGYELVTAPFDGVVTERNVDTGDLISTAGGGTAMFVVQRDDVLRVRVDVPQSDAVGLKDGLTAQVALPERPDQVFTGIVARNAAALNANSRTLPVEIDVKNDAHLLYPGQFVNVTISIPRTAPDVVVPAGAIMFNGQGLRVATIDGDNIVRMHDVTIYRDFGTTVELRSGLAGGERVAINPPANLRDGSQIRVNNPGAQPAATAKIS